MIVRKLRLEKGWSQEQLADLTGLSVRTIQRIERGQKPGLESVKALAAVFEIEVTDLTEEPPMTDHLKISLEEERAMLYVRDIKGFYTNLVLYVLIIGILAVLNLVRSPGHLWVVWPALGWGVGVIFHGLNVFEVFSFFGADWEKRQIARRMNRKK